MANCCITQYAIKGKADDIADLHGIIRDLQGHRESLLPNRHYGVTWIGNLIHALGGDVNAADGRGRWNASSLSLEQDGTVLRFNTESAWRRIEAIGSLIRKKYGNGIAVYYFEEERCCDVLETNDAGGEFFRNLPKGTEIITN